MITKTLIQAQANVLKVTELTIGNVVKVISDDYSKEIQYGIVTDLLNTGEKAYIQIMLFKSSYGDITSEVKVYDGTTDIALFPTTLEEMRSKLDDAVEKLSDKIKQDKESLIRKEHAYTVAKDFIDGTMSKQLTEASYTEITTQQYIEEKKLKEIAEIQNK